LRYKNDSGSLIARILQTRLVCRVGAPELRQRNAASRDQIGSCFSRVSIIASPIVELMEWGSDGVMNGEDFRQFPGAAGPMAKEANALIDKNAPWKMAKEGNAQSAFELLYDAAEALRIVAILISPVLSQAAYRMFDQRNWKMELEVPRERRTVFTR
jgi:hypothetical protein